MGGCASIYFSLKHWEFIKYERQLGVGVTKEPKGDFWDSYWK